jgi:hypothetical protein
MRVNNLAGGGLHPTLSRMHWERIDEELEVIDYEPRNLAWEICGGMRLGENAYLSGPIDDVAAACWKEVMG